MTKSAKLDAPTISLDRPVPVLRAASARQPGGAASEAASLPQIDNELVVELESALKAVLTGEPHLQAEDAADRQAAPVDDARPVQAPAIDRQGSADGAPEPVRPPYLLLRSAEAPEPEQGLSWETGAAADERRPGADGPRRRLPLRAALCVAGLLGLAGAGGIGLMFAAAPGDELEAPLAKPVRTETIRASAAPAATNAQLGAAERQTASEDPIASGATAGEVTLLRPVGASRSAAPVEPAEPSAPFQERPREAPGATQTVKTPDRLVEAPAPAGSVRRVEESAREAPSDHSGAAADEGRVSTASPVAEPAGGAAERLPSEPSAAGEAIVAAVPTPLAEEELVARTGPEAEDDASGAAAPGGAESAEAPQSQQETALTAAGDNGPGQAAAAAGEPTRSAPVTSAVNMRAGPDNGAAILAIVPAGSEVGVIACEHWCEVVFGGERGWIYRSFIGGADS